MPYNSVGDLVRVVVISNLIHSVLQTGSFYRISEAGVCVDSLQASLMVQQQLNTFIRSISTNCFGHPHNGEICLDRHQYCLMVQERLNARRHAERGCRRD